VVGGPFQPVEGHLPLREGPGLGVELDRAALRAAHDRIRENGEVDQAAPSPDTGKFAQLPLY